MLAPFLAPLLKDPYAAVRYVAQRSLRRLPGYESFEYDFLAPAAERTLAVERAMQIWDQARPTDPEHTSGRILIDPTGALDQQRIADLLARRDDRPIDLRE